jgi:hypothetical protein
MNTAITVMRTLQGNTAEGTTGAVWEATVRAIVGVLKLIAL